jgi:glycosyltransferase involved in cell wall biosynthesis
VSDRLRIALDLRSGHEGWLGGLFYLQNLILATRQLPVGEQPDLLGLVPTDRKDFRLDSFASLAELRPFRAGDPSGSIRAKIDNRIRPWTALGSDIPWGAGRAAMKYGVDVLFPTWKSKSTRETAHLPWVPDLQHLHYPANFSAAERAGRERAFRHMSRVAELIVVSSETAAGDFAAQYPGTQSKLRVLRFTTVLNDEAFERDPAETQRRYKLPDRYLLFPAQFWKHKNHRLAFEATRILRDRGIDICLVCTGQTDDYRWPGHFAELVSFLKQHKLASNVRILGVVPRADYVQLLRASTAIIQSSLFEGWNSVVEDARAVGCPLVLSDIPVHIEQNPEGALFFPRGDASALADAVAEVLEIRDLRGDHHAPQCQRERIRAYGRTFSSIAREAAASRYTTDRT